MTREQARPRTLAKIGEVEGFGNGKLERYGAEMLRILRTAHAATAGLRRAWFSST